MGKEYQKNRAGNTIITSVSITEHIKSLMMKYGITPGDAVVRGVAVSLYEQDVYPYNSDLNKKRYEFVKNIEKDLEIMNEIEAFEKKLKNILNSIEALKGGIDKNGLPNKETKDN